MNIVVFGATGGTGVEVVQQALAAGHCVTAVARRPEAITTRHERLVVRRGDVLDAASITAAMLGQDAVISAIGTTQNKPTTLYSNGVANVIAAMRKAGVHRLIGVSSSALEVPDNLPLWQRIAIPLIIQRAFRYIYEDNERMETVIRASDLDWTIVRAPRLTNGAHRGAYRVGYNQHLTQVGISRADLADYLVKHVTDQESYCAQIELAY